ncbi:MAG: hypothetical protein LIP23_02330 [Planctomycetes bacterium]|nr:hypothetical protein [Planctomycetota bacterium]
MGAIFPPTGSQDQPRFKALEQAEREYMLFALELCDTILSGRPEHVEALELAANHLTELGYYADGLELDRRLALLHPDNPAILYNLSCSLSLTGKVEEALATLGRAVDNGYDDFSHMAKDEDLAALRTEPRFIAILARACKSG